MSEKYVDFMDINLPYKKSDVVGIESDGEILNVKIIEDCDIYSILHWKSYIHFNSSDEDPYLKFLGQTDKGNNIIIEIQESEQVRELKENLILPENLIIRHFMIFGSCYIVNVFSEDIPIKKKFSTFKHSPIHPHI